MKHFLETGGGQRSITLFNQASDSTSSMFWFMSSRVRTVLVLTHPVRTVLVLVLTAQSGPVPVRLLCWQQLQLMDSSSCPGPKYQQGNRPKQGLDPSCLSRFRSGGAGLPGSPVGRTEEIRLSLLQPVRRYRSGHGAV